MLSSVEKRRDDKCLSLFPAQLKWIKVFVRKKKESLPFKFFSGSIYLIFCPASPMWQPDAKEQTCWDFTTNADYILASIFTSDIISYDSNPKSKWTLFFFPQMLLALQPRAAISFLNFLPFFIQGNLSGLQFHREIKLYVWPHLTITKYTALYLGLSFLHSLRVIIVCVLQRPPHPAL